ncbi:MAG: hypothetical protein EZS28_003555 [Streblomastix strix]|uniref:Uncharacterized protein n=1 Tax=Streblomastix strix TaxID=222440 RepID=A0A5J4X370_9EUKA|nr:MAG: hypothetical protein EZS28_003555 [Streblomastix strix]
MKLINILMNEIYFIVLGRNRKVKMQIISLHISDATHPFNSKMKCLSVSNPLDSFSSVIHYVEKERPNSDGSSGRVEILCFLELQLFECSVMILSQTDSDTINIVGCGMNETEMCVGLSLSNVMIQGGKGDFVIIWRLNTQDTPIWEQYSEIQESKKINHIIKVSNQLYSDGKTVYDEASKLGLMYVESLNKGDNQGISPVHVEVLGIFVIGCHSAVGSGISITKLLMELTDSVFIEPSCYSNMIYLKMTLGTIEDCIFSGRNGTYQDFNLLNVFEQVEEEGKDMYPNNAQYYSSR